MPNDTPFVELPVPPRSVTQTFKEADARGTDFGSSPADDEHARAVAYRDRIKVVSKAHMDVIVKPLKGNKDAYRSLLHKTLALTNGAPPYLDMP